MKTTHTIPNERGGRPSEGLSAIELIGVLAVIAVLAGMLIPSAIRIIDRMVAEREVTFLGGLTTAFQKAIVRTHGIPPMGSWPAMVATEAGLPTAEITSNPRRNARALLFDKSGWLNQISFPWYQTNGTPPGLSAPPTNARVMVVSSLGRPLPLGLNQSSLPIEEFTALWNTADNTLPASGPLTNWNGDPYDLKVQRIDLSTMFVRVVVSTYLSTNFGYFRIDDSPLNAATAGAGVTRYFLKGSVLHLHSASPGMALQHSEVLEDDTSFVYENGVWRSSIVGSVPSSMGDASGIVEAFLRAPENIRADHTNGAGIQQFLIVSNFVAYMSNYNRWEDQGFTNTALQTYLKNTLQPAMMQSLWGLYEGNTRVPVAR